MKAVQKILIGLSMMFLVFGMSTLVARAGDDDGAKMEVTEDTKVYTSFMDDADVIVHVYKGTIVIVLDSYTDKAGVTWKKIYYYDEPSATNVVGYMSDEYLKYVDAPVSDTAPGKNYIMALKLLKILLTPCA